MCVRQIYRVIFTFTVIISVALESKAKGNKENICQELKMETFTEMLQKCVNNFGESNAKEKLISAIILNNSEISRTKRSTFSSEEQVIVGCVLQCTLQEMAAINQTGFPIEEGLFNTFAEGVTQEHDKTAIRRAVTYCAKNISEKTPITTNPYKEIFNVCLKSFSLFICVVEKIEEYCTQTL